jgi:hypothetical protein
VGSLPVVGRQFGGGRSERRAREAGEPSKGWRAREAGEPSERGRAREAGESAKRADGVNGRPRVALKFF